MEESAFGHQWISKHIFEVSAYEFRVGSVKAELYFAVNDFIHVPLLDLLLDYGEDMLIELGEVGCKSLYVFGILLVHNRHEVVWRVIELGTFETESKIEIIGCLLCCSMVDESTLDHQNEMVKKSIYF